MLFSVVFLDGALFAFAVSVLSVVYLCLLHVCFVSASTQTSQLKGRPDSGHGWCQAFLSTMMAWWLLTLLPAFVCSLSFLFSLFVVLSAGPFGMGPMGAMPNPMLAMQNPMMFPGAGQSWKCKSKT